MSEQETATLDTNELIAQRRAKLEKLREEDQAYPNDFRRDSLSLDLHEKYDDKDNDFFQNSVKILCQKKTTKIFYIGI